MPEALHVASGEKLRTACQCGAAVVPFPAVRTVRASWFALPAAAGRYGQAVLCRARLAKEDFLVPRLRPAIVAGRISIGWSLL